MMRPPTRRNSLTWRVVICSAGGFLLAQLASSATPSLATRARAPRVPVQQLSSADEESRRLLALANQALRRGQQQARSGVETQPAQIEALSATTAPVRSLRLRVRKGWAEFRDTVQIDQSLSGDDSEALGQLTVLLDRRYAVESLTRDIVSPEAVTAGLSTCSPLLTVTIKGLVPPYFNNDTGVRWYRERNVLAYESIATTNAARNECIRGVVDLRSGTAVCTALPCVVR